MGVCCVQLPSAGRRVTGLRYWFVFGETCQRDRLSFCANTGTQGSSAQYLALLFSLVQWPLRGCEQDWANHPYIVQRLLWDAAGRGLWGTAMCAGLCLPLAATQELTNFFTLTPNPSLSLSLAAKITRLGWSGQSTCAESDVGSFRQQCMGWDEHPVTANSVWLQTSSSMLLAIFPFPSCIL